MRFDVICVFPETVENYCSVGIIGRALKKELIKLETHDLKKYGNGKFKKIDDKPYGGGVGLVLKPEPIFKAHQQIPILDKSKAKTILVTPRGKNFNQALIRENLINQEQIIIICGRYEGIDQRVCTLADHEVSLGDFILTGGEIVAMAIIDGVSRLVSGVLSKSTVHLEESFSKWEPETKEYPQYTRPKFFRGLKVPEVLTGGNHKLIEQWRKKNKK